MKIINLSEINFLYRSFFFFLITHSYGLMPLCDISDLITRQVANQAFTIWALLDLAEREHIVDQRLFYDELCQATLKLCKEVQQLKESGYELEALQIDEFGDIFAHLHERFIALPERADNDIRYINAIDIVLSYADYFLKNNLRINPYT